MNIQEKLRIVISGVGNRALPKNQDVSNWLGWVELIKSSNCFCLVGAHDVAKDSLERIVKRGYLKPEQTYCDLDLMLKKVNAEAILISNPAQHHALTIRKALEYNLHLLIEKPFITDLNEGRQLVSLIEKKGRAACVAQNWRSKDVGRLLYEGVQNGLIGRVGHIFFRYVRDRENPSYPQYIFAEEYPLLYSMGIHHLDLFRYILKDEFESVSGHSFKPPWSLYKSDTGLELFLKTKSGIAILYAGTISSKNSIIAQESLVIEGEKGTLFNESQWLEPPLWFFSRGKKEKINLTEEIKRISIAEQYNIADEHILENFAKVIMRLEKPICPVSDALQSVAALEASRLSCQAGKTVFLDQM